MRRTGRLAGSVVALALTITACTTTGGPSASSTSATPAASSSPSSAAPAPSASAPASGAPSASSSPAAAAGPWLRAWLVQALPPQSVFSRADALVITADGVAVQSVPVPTVYPGPAVVPLGGRQLTQGGLDKLIARAKALGLLDGKTDFGSPTLAGAASGYIALTVDGKRVEIQGNPSATIECIKVPCDPAPGTPEAFGTFWRELANLDWLGGDVAASTAYDPPVLSVLVGPAPSPDPKLGANVAIWPLDTPLASFGEPVLNGRSRCGTVTGDDAAKLRAALAKANGLTQWTQSATTSATFGLTVRPLTDGQDACREVFGVG
ncbi:MAG: hypothetical protein U0838_14665 [Chloroflexota bacterium]